MTDVLETWGYLNEGFAVLQEYTDQFIDLPVQPRTTQEEIHAISQEIDAHGRRMSEEISGLQSLFEATVQREIPESIRSKSVSADWARLIRNEISKQVKEQVDEQITEHLPQSLQEQADESRRQLAGIKISLQNSRFYPPNTRSLFGYDLKSAQALNKDYQLTETDDLFMNFQQFLRHIGTAVEVAVSPW
ncbi:hypothetical protein BJ912DRAFT_1038631 [Pholiota molesta]|nr:hypothetical protein BJ912DRAFT_1038631 [Pholiota molesta]